MPRTRLQQAVRAVSMSARIALVAIAVTALTPATALAYIDPLSGSLVLQAVLAGILGAGLTIGRARDAAVRAVTRFWQRLTG